MESNLTTIQAAQADTAATNRFAHTVAGIANLAEKLSAGGQAPAAAKAKKAA